MVEFLPAVSKNGHAPSTCLCCPTKPVEAPMDMIICVGFGDAGVTKNKELVWSEQSVQDTAKDWDDFWTVADAEKVALEEPDEDWRIYKMGAMWEGEWQRQGPSKWVLISTGMGFA